VDPSPLTGVILGLAAAWLAFVLLLWLLRPRDVRLGELARVVPDIARLCRDIVADRRAPLGARISVVILLAYLVNPIDLTPEFIPVLGPLDDVVVAVLVLRYVRRRLGEDELRGLWRGTPEGFGVLRSVTGSGNRCADALRAGGRWASRRARGRSREPFAHVGRKMAGERTAATPRPRTGDRRSRRCPRARRAHRTRRTTRRTTHRTSPTRCPARQTRRRT
jgi:uncharacterized membrane protein YkvA (DUF1232 family)